MPRYSFDIDEVDQLLEIALLIRSGEIGFARDYRNGHAFGIDGDRYRLDAFTLGLLDALAHRLGDHLNTLNLLIYLWKLMENGPGKTTRQALRETGALGDDRAFSRYVSGGRRHILLTLAGNSPAVGRFAELLAEELTAGSRDDSN